MSANKNQLVPANRSNGQNKFLTEPFKIIEQYMREFDEMVNRSFKNDFRTMDFGIFSPELFSKQSFGFSEQSFIEKDGKYVYEMPIAKEDLKFVSIKEEDRMISITIKEEIVEEGKNFKSSSMKQTQQLLSIPKDAVPGTVIAKYSHGILTLFIDQKLNLKQK